MRGTDISNEELEHARAFLEHISKVKWPSDNQRCAISRDQLIRVVAWYGAIRANGDGSGRLYANGEPLETSSASQLQGDARRSIVGEEGI
jgi:hypothetical protein